MKTYQMDEYLLMFLNSLYSEFKQKRIKEMFNLLYNFNIMVGNAVVISLPTLEQALINVIVCTDSENDTKATHIESYLKEYTIEYLKKYGIYLNHEIELYQAVMVMESMYTMLSVNIDLIEPIKIKMEQIENYDSDVMFLSSLLSDYGELAMYENVTIIEDVNEDFFQKLIVYLNNRTDATLAEFSDKTVKLINLLSEADTDFIDTDIVKEVIANGYSDLTIKNYLDNLYLSINKYGLKLKNIAYEIVAVFYIAFDTKNDILTGINEYVNFEAIPALNEKAESVDIVMSMINDLVLKLKPRS